MLWVWRFRLGKKKRSWWRFSVEPFKAGLSDNRERMRRVAKTKNGRMPCGCGRHNPEMGGRLPPAVYFSLPRDAVAFGALW